METALRFFLNLGFFKGFCNWSLSSFQFMLLRWVHERCPCCRILAQLGALEPPNTTFGVKTSPAPWVIAELPWWLILVLYLVCISSIWRTSSIKSLERPRQCNTSCRFLAVPIFHSICSTESWDLTLCMRLQSFACYAQPFKARIFYFAYYLQHCIVGTFLFACYLQHFAAGTFYLLASCNIWKLEPSIVLASATCGSWNLRFCMIFAYMSTSWGWESSIWHAICKLLLVVGCWLLSFSCGFLFVLLFLLQL